MELDWLCREWRCTDCVENGDVQVMERMKMYMLFREGSWTGCVENEDVQAV
jgi:hypothetical protein